MCKTSGTTGTIKEVIKAPNRQNDLAIWGFFYTKATATGKQIPDV